MDSLGLQMLQTKIDRTIPSQEFNVPKVGIKDMITQPPDSLIPQYLNKDETFQDLGGGNLFRTTESMQQQNRDHPSQSESTYVSQEDTTVLGFFEDLTFLIVGFDEDIQERLQEMVTRCGGTIVGNKFLGVPDYAVVPFIGAAVHHTTDEIVSYLWVEDCHDKGELVPLEYFHRPVTVQENIKPLSGCVIGITSYSCCERNFIVQLTIALGAIAQDVLSRKVCVEKNAKATTHLICPEPGSQKYVAALKWKVPVVTHEWVLACLKTGRKVGLKPYLVGDSTAPLEELEDNQKPTERESTLSAVRDTSKNSSASKSGELKKECTPAVTRESPGANAISRLTSVEQGSTPLTSRPKSKSSTDTGGTSVGRAAGLATTVPSTSSATTTPASVTHISNPSVTLPVSEDNPLAGGAGLINSGMEAPLNTPVNTSHHYGFSQETPLNISRIRAQPSNSPCLRRAALTPKLDQHLASKVDQITPITPKPPGYIETPETPYGLGTDPSPETRKNWIRWVNSFPDLKKDDVQPETKRRDSTPLSELYRKCWAKIGGSDQTQEDAENTQTRIQSAGESIDVETPIRSARKRLSLNDSPESSHPLAPINSQASGTTGIITQLANLNELLASPGVQQPSSRKRTSAALESDGCERSEEARVKLAKIPREPSIKEVAWTYDASQADTATTYKFMLSTLEEEDRKKYSAIITRLGGSVANYTTFDPTATHLISNRLSRSEKLLASIASGKWVLHVEYLDISDQHGCFVKEEPYEWGNSATLHPDTPKTLDSDLARSCHYWRKKLAKSGQEGAFKGIRAIMATDSLKEGPLTRMILAGGGTIANSRPPFSEADGATYCFIETSKIQYMVDLPALVEKGVWCVPPIFLSNCLLQFPPPDPAACQIPEVKHYLDKLAKQS